MRGRVWVWRRMSEAVKVMGRRVPACGGGRGLAEEGLEAAESVRANSPGERGGMSPCHNHPAFTCLLLFLPIFWGRGQNQPGARVGGCLSSTRALTCVGLVC